MLFRFLVQSLCPSIYGHEIVKAGLLLAMLGGSSRDSARAESHVMLVGDPGLGKSQMLKSCTNIAPRGEFFECFIRIYTVKHPRVVNVYPGSM